MVFKKGKDNHLQEIFNVVKRELPICTYQQLLQLKPKDDFFKRVSSYFPKTKYKYPSVVYRVICKEKVFSRLFLGDDAHVKPVTVAEFRVALDMLGTDVANLDKSHRSKQSLFGKMCALLRKKNTLKNRYQLYRFWRAEINSHKIFEEDKLFCGDTHINARDNESDNSKNYNSALEIQTPVKINEELSVYKSPKLSCKRKLFHGVYTSTPLKEDFSKSDGQIEVDVPSPIPKLEKKVLDESTSHADVTTADFDIPTEMLDLSDANVGTPVLPINSKNESLRENVVLNYKDCTVFEGEFRIDDKMWRVIYDGSKLNSKHYPFYIRHRIVKFVNNTCQLAFKFVKYLKKEKNIKLFASCIHNNHSCKKFKIVIDKNRRVKVFSTSLNYCHKQKLTTYVKGIERCLIRKKLYHVKPSQYKRRTILSSDKNLVKIGNLQDIKSDSTLRRIKAEATSILDRDKNDILDIIEMQNVHEEYIKEVAFPFNIKMYSIQQLHVLEKQSAKEEWLPIHFDATGGIVRNPSGSKRVYLYSAVIRLSRAGRVFPIFDMISSVHYSKAIFKILHDFRTFCEENDKWPLFSSVITDFSFASLHAVCKAFNRMTLLDYLNYSYQMTLKDVYVRSTTFITIHLCCAHFMKMVINDISRFSKNSLQHKLFTELIASAITMKSIESLENWFRDVCVLLSSEMYDTNAKKAHFSLLLLCCDGETYSHEELTVDEIDDNDDLNGPLYKSSPYYKLFKRIHESSVQNNAKAEKENINEYYNPEFLEVILTKYVPYCPLWTGLHLPHTVERISNSVVENYFGNVKRNVLCNEKYLKCSRFVRKLREYVLSLYEEAKMDIGKSGLTAKNKRKLHIDDADERLSQETWKRHRTIRDTHFTGRYLKEQKHSMKTAIENKSEIILDDQPRCLYCGYARLDTTVDWVQCDICDGWIHQHCETSCDKSFSGSFMCKMCCRNTEEGLLAKENKSYDLSEKCNQFLDSLYMTEDEIRKLEVTTRKQRFSRIWVEERKKRLTASNFARVCKCKAQTAFERILKDVLRPTDISYVPSIKHGIDNEDNAIAAYENLTGRICRKAGLHIHRKHFFLGASPDAVVTGTDGIVEVKCPFKYKSKHPNDIRFDCLDDAGNLKKSHPYYYQVQGSLEVSNKFWCDFVLYTYKGIKIVRVQRDEEFWNSIYHKLKTFYHFYMLPRLALPGETFSSAEIKWTSTKHIVLLKNGLVDDPTYYKNFPNNRGYIVCRYQHLDSNMPDILIDDFVSLNGTSWLSSLVVDVSLRLYNHNDVFQVISTERSTIIYNGDSSRLTKYFMDGTKVNKTKIAMPIIINNNHFCLAVANFEDKTFIFLDPLGSTQYKTSIYFKKFRKFLHLHNITHNSNFAIDNWQHLAPDHIRQEDSYNCGLYVIYFFRCIAKEENLLTYKDMRKYRSQIQKMLLTHSCEVGNACMFCGRSAGNDVLTCTACKRSAHKKCVLTKPEIDKGIKPADHYVNSICDLCRQY